MQHKVSNTPIYFSSDYKSFKKITGNRQLNETKIKHIIQDIDKGLDMLRYCPIVVAKDLSIIDGQHRYQVSKILKKPVYYVIADEITLSQIASINSRTERWKPMDFVECYAECGNPEYVKLKKIIKEYDLPVSSALHVLSNGFSSNMRTPKLKKLFEEGNFTIQYEDEAIRIIDFAIRFDKLCGNRSGAFLDAIAFLFRQNLFDEDVLMTKYHLIPEALTPQSGRKAYLVKLEEIYNYRNSKRQAIY